MKLVQKSLLSLFLATVSFAVFAVVAYSGLFQVIDDRFYNERVRDSARSILEEIRSETERYQVQLVEAVGELASLPAIRNVFLINQSRQDIEEQVQGTGRFFENHPETDYIRIVDNDRGNLWFSTLDEDVRERADTFIEYLPIRNLDPPVSLPPPDEETSGIQWIAERGGARVTAPVIDSFGIPQGLMVVWVNTNGLFTRLVAEGVLGPSHRIRITPNGTLVYNAPRHFGGTDLQFVDQYIDADGLGLLASDVGAAFTVEYSEGTDQTPSMVYLINESELHMDGSLRWILLAAVFIVTFLFAYLLLNIRQDPDIIVAERFQRFQQAVLKDYIREGRAVSPDVWRRELDGRKERIEVQLRKGLGRVNEETRTKLQQDMDRNWNELYRLMGSPPGGAQRAELEQVSLQQIEAIIERTLARYGSAPPTQRPTPEPIAPPEEPSSSDPLAETKPLDGEMVGELEAIGELEEIEGAEAAGAADVGELEAIGELEEIEEAEAAGAADVGELEAIDELEEIEGAEAAGAADVGELEAIDELEEIEEQPAEHGRESSESDVVQTEPVPAVPPESIPSSGIEVSVDDWPEIETTLLEMMEGDGLASLESAIPSDEGLDGTSTPPAAGAAEPVTPEELDPVAELEPIEEVETFDEADTGDETPVQVPLRLETGRQPFLSAAQSFGGTFDHPVMEEISTQHGGDTPVVEANEPGLDRTKIRGVENSTSYHVVELDDFVAFAGRSRGVIEERDGLAQIQVAAYFDESVGNDHRIRSLAEQVIGRYSVGGIEDVMGAAFDDVDFDDLFDAKTGERSSGGDAPRAGTSDLPLKFVSGEFDLPYGGEPGEAGLSQVYRDLVTLTRRWDARVTAILEPDASGGLVASFTFGMPSDCPDVFRVDGESDLVMNVCRFRRVALLKQRLDSFEDFSGSCYARKLAAIGSWFFLPLNASTGTYLLIGFQRSFEDLLDLTSRYEVVARVR